MLFQRRKHTAKRRWRLSAKLLIASSVATVIGFSAICASVMLDMRRGEEQLARQMLENLASGIDADIGRNIELYDLSLRAVATNMVMPEIKDVSKPILHLILFDHAATAKHFGAIQVFDTRGQLTIDASSLDPRPENRADEEYFQVHRDNPDVGLFISKPMLHRGAYSIVLSRRISGDDGGFLGVVVGRDPLSLFPRAVRPAQSRRRTTPSRCCAATAPSSCAGRSTSTSSARTSRPWRRRGARTSSRAADLTPDRARWMRRRGCSSAATRRVRSTSWSASRWRRSSASGTRK